MDKRVDNLANAEHLPYKLRSLLPFRTEEALFQVLRRPALERDPGLLLLHDLTAKSGCLAQDKIRTWCHLSPVKLAPS